MTNQIGSVEDNPRWDPSSEVEAIPSPRASARGHEKKRLNKSTGHCFTHIIEINIIGISWDITIDI